MDNNSVFDSSIAPDSKPSHIKGIACSVKNCIHNDDCYCTAPKINVGPGYATSCTDTVCATFKARQ